MTNKVYGGPMQASDAVELIGNMYQEHFENLRKFHPSFSPYELSEIATRLTKVTAQSFMASETVAATLANAQKMISKIDEE